MAVGRSASAVFLVDDGADGIGQLVESLWYGTEEALRARTASVEWHWPGLLVRTGARHDDQGVGRRNLRGNSMRTGRFAGAMHLNSSNGIITDAW